MPLLLLNPDIDPNELIDPDEEPAVGDVCIGMSPGYCCGPNCINWTEDFNRPDNATIGNFWTKNSGTAEIKDNELKITSATADLSHPELFDYNYTGCALDIDIKVTANCILKIHGGPWSDYSVNNWIELEFGATDILRVYISNVKQVECTIATGLPRNTWFTLKTRNTINPGCQCTIVTGGFGGDQYVGGYAYYIMVNDDIILSYPTTLIFFHRSIMAIKCSGNAGTIYIDNIRHIKNLKECQPDCIPQMWQKERDVMDDELDFLIADMTTGIVLEYSPGQTLVTLDATPANRSFLLGDETPCYLNPPHASQISIGTVQILRGPLSRLLGDYNQIIYYKLTGLSIDLSVVFNSAYYFTPMATYYDMPTPRITELTFGVSNNGFGVWTYIMPIAINNGSAGFYYAQHGNTYLQLGGGAMWGDGFVFGGTAGIQIDPAAWCTNILNLTKWSAYLHYAFQGFFSGGQVNAYKENGRAEVEYDL